MVKFLNQKEEVISIELTPYGRDKFSKGEFSPFYYAFYDESVLYDNSYTKWSAPETQNSIVSRIKTRSLSTEPITKFTSSLAPVVSLGQTIDSDGKFLETNEWNSSFYRFLGKGSPWVPYAPAWEIYVTTESDIGLNDGLVYTSNGTVPQMSATIETDYFSFDVPESENRTYSLLGANSILLDVQEINTIFNGGGNFDVEVFISGSRSNGFRTRPLGFVNKASTNSFDLLEQAANPLELSENIRGNNEEIRSNFPVIDHTFVEFYLNISVDNEITDPIEGRTSSTYRGSDQSSPADICDIVDEVSSREGR